MRKSLASVRARAALGATLVVAIALVGAGVVLLIVLRGNLIGQADLHAEISARDVASQVATGVAYDDLEMPDDDEPVQVVDEKGRVRAVSEDLQAVSGTGTGRVTPQPGPGAAPSPGASASPGGDDDDDEDAGSEQTDGPQRGEVSDETDVGGGEATVDGDAGDYRFARIEATTSFDETVTVYAGAPLTTEQAAVGTVRNAMLVGLPVLLLVVAGVTWLMTRRALRPVEGIRREMAAITASEDLTRRVPESSAGDEVSRLARTTNETLSALESSVERQRRFVADASHELRSPIASLRTQLEVGVAHPELLDVDGAVADTVRLQRLAADLLLLARLDAGERPADGRVELDRLVRTELSQRNGDRLPVRVAELSELRVAGSRGQLGRVLGNLLDNAQRHAGSEVVVRVRREAGWAVLEVADDGAGVPETERERIFERFVRLDDARARDDGGAGLGLAIARDVAVRHGGTLTVEVPLGPGGPGETPSGGAVFVLRLPIVE
ncbi:sensor histidine kinase [Streptomyces sp. H27-D2]|uniref:sensor histidine kinase n=1 Tax=Streptomyces sp. H27-D2 TaxID=3046304 RepID=UPI002DBFB771|nr:HAMP domain-containing sensor histidine kinase [Streptomyces sp. H27-D2]MEC4018410.1 HAMP domain-containing sensor histidine kinase [Streptomyces sp. H27-D2]